MQKMKSKHIVGLDIGTNSLGWCLIKEFEDDTIEIIKTGVHIFPIGTIVDDKSNKEKTRNEQRRHYRGASRMRYRFKLRRKNLTETLKQVGMLPDYTKYNKAKGLGQSYELYKLRADAINPSIQVPLEEIGRIFLLLNKYRGFKSNAKNLQKLDADSGIVKKGYESLQKLINDSGAQTIGEYFFKMHEKAKTLYNENRWHNCNEPIDERAYNDQGEIVLFNSNGIRRHHGRYTLREMYLLEFDKIWQAQKKYYPEIFTGSKKEYDSILSLPYRKKIDALKQFKKTNYWHIREYCIYYQRPLKSQKKYVSNCQFERGAFDVKKYFVEEKGIEKSKEKRIWKTKAKKTCPKSHPLFQEFRIWQKLHQIYYSSISEDVFRKPLKQEWLPVLAEYLMCNFDLYLNETKKAKIENKYWFEKVLRENKIINNQYDYNFFIDKTDEDVISDDKNENKITGNVTYASFRDALGDEKFNFFRNALIERTEQINEEEVIGITESKLLQLWHHLYIARDGLFKEDDWLKCILTESTKWNLTESQAEKLISKGLVEDYGSYSSKVLKAILPYMRKGLNEYDALKATQRNYINEDNTIGTEITIKDKISQLSYQELRNPVVERALSKAIKLVNTLLERYKDEIDRDSLEIRIESTRQFKKPRQERENERRRNADKDKTREQYAVYLTKNKEKLGFNRDIYKYDSIVSKYELWLQMNMNEDDETFINEFKAFSKITKQEDKLKHKLWLECGRMCPYTGNIINFTDCFSSEVEIEHIIPLSRSLDDSFNNKTLTFRGTNAEKGSMTAWEYLNKRGEGALKEFKVRIKSKLNDFSDSKKELFLAENVKQGFSSDQIGNTSYIAKYTRKKMQEVCRNVQFTNGSATAELRNYDWSLSNLLDRIRYEEDLKINIDDYYKSYYRIKNDFVEWYRKRFNTADFKIDWIKLSENEDIKQYITETNNDLLYWNEGIQQFNTFRNRSGKKDRSDHRHHAIDAFIIASCSPKIIKELSTYNAIREEQQLEKRNKVEKGFNYIKLKESIANILVSHSEKQTLIKKRKNRIRTKEGVCSRQTTMQSFWQSGVQRNWQHECRVC
jgi:CRISPR-associated endonuclease Csn1